MVFSVRPIQAGDAAQINAIRRMPGVFENMLALPSEREKWTEDFIVSLGPDNHEFVTVAETPQGEQVIGMAGLTVNANPRLRHSGSVGIMVSKDYQSQGVGTLLMKTLLDLADNWLLLVRVELGVYSDNERAIHLYQKMGFEQEGIRRKAAIRNGTSADEIVMARIRGV